MISEFFGNFNNFSQKNFGHIVFPIYLCRKKLNKKILSWKI